MDRIIVELLPQHGQVAESRLIFDKKRITLGRSYSNDVILDDLYVSPEHLLIAQHEGKILIKDLASENATQVNGKPKFKGGTVKVNSGDIISIGRTRLKLLLADHPVEPAKPLDYFMSFRDFIDRPWVPFGFSFCLIAVAEWLAYQGSPGDRFWNQEFYSTLMGYSAWILSIAGLLSLYTFFKYKKSYFVRNLVVSNIGLFLTVVLSELDPFIYFWILDEVWIQVLDYATGYIILTGIFWASVRLTKDTIGWRDLIRLSIIPFILLSLIAFSENTNEFDFNKNKPSYHDKIAPGMSPLFEPLTLDEFLKQGGQEFDRFEP